MLTCGWMALPDSDDPDKACGAPVSVAYVVQAHELPLIHGDSEPKKMAIALCPAHDPAIATTEG